MSRATSTHFLDALLARDRLPRTFAGPRVGPGPLAVHRQALAMSQPAVAADVAQSTDGLLHLASKLPFDHVLVIEQRGELGEFVFGQVAGTLVRTDPRPLA